MNSFVKVNHLSRNSEDSVEFLDLYKYIKSNNCINKLDEGSIINNLLIKAVNNGAFFRNAKSRESFNYWQPLSNAGIPAVPRADYIHESTFLVHDILHNNIPDLQLDINDQLNKKVYFIHRVLGEGICLVLADMYFIDTIKDKFPDYDFGAKNIYSAFKSIEHRSLYENIKANAIYSVLGTTDLFKVCDIISKDTKKYIDWFKPVYISDHKWTLNNISNISSNFVAHKKWLNDYKDYINKCYEVVTTSTLIMSAGIDNKMSNEEVTEKIFDFIYNKYLKEEKVNIIPFSERAVKSNIIYHSFQGRIFYDYPFNLDLKSKYLEALALLDFNLCKRIYNDFLSNLLKKRIINKKKYDIYSEIYPMFNAFFISYDEDKVADITLKECSDFTLSYFDEV